MPVCSVLCSLQTQQIPNTPPEMQPQKTQLRKPVKPDSVIRKYFRQRSGEKSLTMERQVKR